jgi:hypothetical protein
MATTTTEEGSTATRTPSPIDSLEVVWKKPVRLSPNGMGVVIPQSFVELLQIDDDQTWLQMILTDEGLLMKPVDGMPSNHNDTNENAVRREN